jgi:hypothetical protein
MALEFTHRLTEMRTRSLPEGGGARLCRLVRLIISAICEPIFYKILQPRLLTRYGLPRPVTSNPFFVLKPPRYSFFLVIGVTYPLALSIETTRRSRKPWLNLQNYIALQRRAPFSYINPNYAYSRSRSHVTTDGQSVSMSRYRAHSQTCDEILLSVRKVVF